MAGYDWQHGKSNNAVQAEYNGERTASALARVIGNGVTAADVQRVFSPSSWHHTSGRYSKTNYYFEPVIEILVRSPGMVPEDILRTVANEYGISRSDLPPDHVALKREELRQILDLARQRKKAGKDIRLVVANVSWKVFARSRGAWKLAGEERLLEVKVTLKGDWATFQYNGQNMRKKVSSSAFQIDVIREVAP